MKSRKAAWVNKGLLRTNRVSASYQLCVSVGGDGLLQVLTAQTSSAGQQCDKALTITLWCKVCCWNQYNFVTKAKFDLKAENVP